MVTASSPERQAIDCKHLTVDHLVAWYLEFARQDRGLDHSTLTGYADAYSHWLKEPIGHKRASSITMAELDNALGRMRRAGLSRSRMTNARALLRRVQMGRRHGKVTSNPVDGFELPTSTHSPRHTTAPELDELLRLLATQTNTTKCLRLSSNLERPPASGEANSRACDAIDCTSIGTS